MLGEEKNAPSFVNADAQLLGYQKGENMSVKKVVVIEQYSRKLQAKRK